MDWLFQSGFDTATTFALWSIVAVFVTTVILFTYTMGLRVATLTAERQRQKLLSVWREVIASAVMSSSAAGSIKLPKIRRSDRINLLEEWNRTRSSVAGVAIEHLISLADRLQIPSLAAVLLRKRKVRSKILAVQTIGHLRDASHWDEVRALVVHDNVALSVTAAEALVEIDAAKGVEIVVPMIADRREWPKNRVSILLRQAGSELVSEPMYRAIRAADDSGRSYLLQFAHSLEAEVLDALVADLLSSSNNPGVLNAALKLVSGFKAIPRVAWLTQHDVWFVRMQAAKALGRIGQREHLRLLEALLDDKEWWVRYRAAQSIVALPFMGPNQLRQVQHEQQDPFARDILQQAFAEVGLA